MKEGKVVEAKLNFEVNGMKKKVLELMTENGKLEMMVENKDNDLHSVLNEKPFFYLIFHIVAI